MLSHSRLEGDFVVLRPLRPEDAEITFRWRHSQRAKLLNKAASTVEQQADWIAKRPPDEYNFIIELKAGQPVGMLSLTNIDHTNRHAEPGRFLIGEETAVRGKPIAVEAMKLLYQLAFEKLGLMRLYGIVAENNPSMIKWQKYLGMREEGRLRNHLCQNDEFYDAVLLGLLLDEYQNISLPKMNSLIALARPNTDS